MCVKRLVKDEAGTSAIEFAFVFPMLCVLIFGIFELGLGMYYGSTVRWALETSARTLLIAPQTTQDQLQSDVRVHLADIPGGGAVPVTLTLDATDPSAQTYVASASYTYQLGVPLLPLYQFQFTPTVTVPKP